MNLITDLPICDVIKLIRAEAGRAEFVMIVMHDDEMKLNDFGDVAIPSRSTSCCCLDLWRSDAELSQRISDFRLKFSK